MHTPAVSVVLPTYERPEYLRRALAGAVAQTLEDLEIIVADDHSSAETGEVAASFGDPRIRHERSPANLGFYVNSLRAYAGARGRYVATLHDDDEWQPTLLQRLVEPLETDGELVASFSDVNIIRTDGSIDTSLTEVTSRAYGRSDLPAGRVESIARAALIERSLPLIVATVVRRDAIHWDDVPERSWRIFELWLLYRLALTGRGAWYCPERLAGYRVHPGSATASAGLEWHECFAFCWEAFLDDPRLGEWHDVFRARLVQSLANLALGLVRAGRNGDARRVCRAMLGHSVGPRELAIAACCALPPSTARRIAELASARGPRRTAALVEPGTAR